jgi:LPS-assembly protein
VLGVNYVTSFSYATATSPPILDHVFMLQLGLRTLANTSTQ